MLNACLDPVETDEDLPSGIAALTSAVVGKSALDMEALLVSVLEQVAYGLALVHMDTRQIRFANGLAQDALQAPGSLRSGLCETNGRLSTFLRVDGAQLDRALQRAKAGARGLISLGGEGTAPSVAVVPLPLPSANGHALLVFSKHQLCDSSTVALFARERGLTGAEGNVLAAVCTGLRPREIASRHGVQISTVRSQLRSIRLKTRCETIRQLVETISVLPPMARHLSACG